MSRDCYVALLAVWLACLQFVIVVFPDHTHLLFLRSDCSSFHKLLGQNKLMSDLLHSFRQ